MALSRWMSTALACLATAGCGVSEGDYLVYRVSTEALSVSDACYFPDEAPPADVAEDTDSFLTPSTWTIFFAHGDRIVLDAAGTALEGEETDEGFSFVAHTVDVEYIGTDQREAKLTTTTRTSIEMRVDGDAIDGDHVQLETTRCDFLTATPAPDLCEPTPDCERRAGFSGVRLDDVELRSSVDDPPPT